jgi:hypothetical protein
VSYYKGSKRHGPQDCDSCGREFTVPPWECPECGFDNRVGVESCKVGRRIGTQRSAEANRRRAAQ